MSNTKSFIKLDFITMKPYLGVKNLLIFAAIALYLAIIGGSPYSSIGIGILLGVLFTGYPFALGEKCNMDALYATLAVDRKGVVRGRYLSVLILDGITVLCSFLLSTAVLFLLKEVGFNIAESDAGNSFLSYTAAGAVFLVLQASQLPLYFRFGYAKAKFITVIPLTAVVAAYTTLVVASSRHESYAKMISELAQKIEQNKIAFALLIVAALVVIMFISYTISLACYKKREF